jgi:uncharacterized membrane protein YfcA
MELFGLQFGEIALRVVLGLFIGFCIGLTGVGGGVLGLQATTLALKMDPIAAVGTTSLYIFLTNISASFHHARLKNIAWGAAARLLSGAVPASVLVSCWISRKGADAGFQQGLKNFIIGVVFLTVSIMVVNAVNSWRNRVEEEELTLAAKIQGHWMLRNVLCVALGGGIGGLIGATSIGGGVLIVPMLMIIFGLTASLTVGTSTFIAMVLTLATALIYGKGGVLDAKTAIIMAAGSQGGVWFGSRLSSRLPDRQLRAIVISLIFTAAVIMFINR